MSKREDLQEHFYQYVIDKHFNAPYGVIKGQESFGPKARTLTFGKAAIYDITMRIVSPTNIFVKSSRHGQTQYFGNDAVTAVEQFLASI